MSVRVRLGEVVRLRCGCGDWFDLSTRANRDRLRDGREPVCTECRRAPIILVTDELVAWWEERMTPEEALPIAELIFGPRESWTSTLSIRRIVEEAAGCTEEDYAEIMSA